jgi:hypothetical protein
LIRAAATVLIRLGGLLLECTVGFL